MLNSKQRPPLHKRQQQGKQNPNQKEATSAKSYPESEIRQRIRGIIEAGGIHPISPTGVQNLARLFYRSPEAIREIIREESAKIGREVYDA